MRKMRSIKLFVLSLFLFLFSFSAIAQLESQPEKIWIGKSILQDQKHILTSPTRITGKDVKYILPIAGAAFTLYMLDENFTKQVIEFREKNPPFHEYAKNATLQGETWAQGALPIVTYLAGAAFKNERVKQTGAIMVSSLINTQVITFASKGFFGRQRPDYNDGNDKWHWFEFGTFDSFFSGHSSGAWALATTIAKRHNSKKIVPIVCYTLASSVSLSRVVLQRHWSSDVFIGAVVGYTVANYMVKKHENTKWSIFPKIGRKGAEVSMVYTY